MDYTLEVIAFDIESCLMATKTGADRIELCDNQADGGTTPSFGLIKMARKITDLDLFPIIRPRGGDFLYNDEEFEIMKEDVLLCKQLGCNGVVLGILQRDGKIDKKRTSSLVQIAYPMSVTFHRAFDRSKDPFEALEDIIEIGCERILTSGQAPTAMEGAELIKKLVYHADERIIIMPGSGVQSNNISELASITGAKEFHSSARTFIDSKMVYQPALLKEGMKKVQINEIEVKKMLEALAAL
jgi:copper homeostasis protein